MTAASLQAATLPIADDFAGAEVDKFLPGRIIVTGDTKWETADADQFPKFFDRGDGNIAIEWNKGANNRRIAFAIPPMTQGVLSGDFCFIQDGLQSDGTVRDVVHIRVANAALLTATGTNASAFIDRSIQGIELNTWHTATLIFNGDVADLQYATTGLTNTKELDGFGTVASGKADVFLDGNLITNDANGIVGQYTHAGIALFFSSSLPTTNQIVQYDNFSLTEVVQNTTPKWAGYPVDPSGWVDTTPWLGWINVAQGSYVWSVSFAKYIYLPEAWVGSSGAWTYIPGN
jgi:hypothetical protein